MNRNLVLLLLAVTFPGYSQDDTQGNNSIRYIQIDLSVPLRGNTGNELPDEITTKEYWFMPDGIAAKIGIGVHHNQLFALGIHGGVDFKASEKLVAAPIFLNMRVAPSVGDDKRIYVQLGYGYAFAIGRGDLSGNYKKAIIGIESDDGLSLFIEISQYGFSKDGINKIGNLSVGLSRIIF